MIQLGERRDLARNDAVAIGKESVWPLLKEAVDGCEVMRCRGSVVEFPVIGRFRRPRNEWLLME